MTLAELNKIEKTFLDKKASLKKEENKAYFDANGKKHYIKKNYRELRVIEAKLEGIALAKKHILEEINDIHQDFAFTSTVCEKYDKCINREHSCNIFRLVLNLIKEVERLK